MDEDTILTHGAQAVGVVRLIEGGGNHKLGRSRDDGSGARPYASSG